MKPIRVTAALLFALLTMPALFQTAHAQVATPPAGFGEPCVGAEGHEPVCGDDDSNTSISHGYGTVMEATDPVDAAATNTSALPANGDAAPAGNGDTSVPAGNGPVTALPSTGAGDTIEPATPLLMLIGGSALTLVMAIAALRSARRPA